MGDMGWLCEWEGDSRAESAPVGQCQQGSQLGDGKQRRHIVPRIIGGALCTQCRTERTHHDAAQHSTAQHSTAQHSTAQRNDSTTQERDRGAHVLGWGTSLARTHLPACSHGSCCVLHGDAPPHGDGSGGLAPDPGLKRPAVGLKLTTHLPPQQQQQQGRCVYHERASS